MAQNRFSMLERRLNRCPELKEGYVNFMKEYEALGHMSPLQSFDSNMRHFFIPHHCVHRPQSLSTKLRVVFDGSAKSTSGKSLNDLLLCGPTIQQDLITTVLAFRLHRFVLTGDITKMYRQFMIDPRDRLFQLILWRENPTDPMKVYQLNTVTYGLSSAPFLAIRSLQYLASESRSEFPAGASVLCNDLYVDDLLTGADTVEELLEKKRQVVQILRKGNMSMSKFNSNSHIIGGLSATEVAIKFEEEEITKALGLSWQPQKDYFVYRYDLSSDNTFTKRIVLSTIASLFDALGLLSPVTIRCKILLQDLHILKLGWDEPLPDTQNELWSDLRNDLKDTPKLKFPRYMHTSPSEPCEVHGFADASERAYGCYLLLDGLKDRSSMDDDACFKTELFCSKQSFRAAAAQRRCRMETCTVSTEPRGHCFERLSHF
ncbi:uncharacterized protein [Drosophila takahashii]|uniref:uncharacterized protein n=1 Tax=Drosophila takahashii TaxID=29030 RepID=UPI003898EC7E